MPDPLPTREECFVRAAPCAILIAILLSAPLAAAVIPEDADPRPASGSCDASGYAYDVWWTSGDTYHAHRYDEGTTTTCSEVRDDPSVGADDGMGQYARVGGQGFRGQRESNGSFTSWSTYDDGIYSSRDDGSGVYEETSRDQGESIFVQGSDANAQVSWDCYESQRHEYAQDDWTAGFAGDTQQGREVSNADLAGHGCVAWTDAYGPALGVVSAQAGHDCLAQTRNSTSTTEGSTMESQWTYDWCGFTFYAPGSMMQVGSRCDGHAWRQVGTDQGAAWSSCQDGVSAWTPAGDTFVGREREHETSCDQDGCASWDADAVGASLYNYPLGGYDLFVPLPA